MEMESVTYICFQEFVCMTAIFYFILRIHVHTCDVWTVIYALIMELEPVIYNNYV